MCMSYSTTNRMMNLIGVGHDALVKTWRDIRIVDFKEVHEKVDTQYSNLFVSFFFPWLVLFVLVIAGKSIFIS